MLAAVLLGYLVGSLPLAWLLLRQGRGVDLRLAGSGNVGAANVLRVGGLRFAMLAALLDVGKGATPVWLASTWRPDPMLPAVAGVAAVIGHIYPIWLRFHGGKGVATACGVFSVLTPWAVWPSALLFAATVWTTRYISLGSVAGVVTVALVNWTGEAPLPHALAATVVAALIVFRHRGNLHRIRARTERRIGGRL